MASTHKSSLHVCFAISSEHASSRSVVQIISSTKSFAARVCNQLSV